MNTFTEKKTAEAVKITTHTDGSPYKATFSFTYKAKSIRFEVRSTANVKKGQEMLVLFDPERQEEAVTIEQKESRVDNLKVFGVVCCISYFCLIVGFFKKKDKDWER